MLFGVNLIDKFLFVGEFIISQNISIVKVKDLYDNRWSECNIRHRRNKIWLA